MAFGVCLFLRATVVNLYFLLQGRQHFGKSKFKQAVINIGKNAIEAMPNGANRPALSDGRAGPDGNDHDSRYWEQA